MRDRNSRNGEQHFRFGVSIWIYAFSSSLAFRTYVFRAEALNRSRVLLTAFSLLVHPHMLQFNSFSSFAFLFVFLATVGDAIAIAAADVVVVVLSQTVFIRDIAEFPMFYTENFLSCMSVVHVCHAFRGC